MVQALETMGRQGVSTIERLAAAWEREQAAVASKTEQWMQDATRQAEQQAAVSQETLKVPAVPKAPSATFYFFLGCKVCCALMVDHFEDTSVLHHMHLSLGPLSVQEWPDLVRANIEEAFKDAQEALAERQGHLHEWAQETPGVSAMSRLWAAAAEAARQQVRWPFCSRCEHLG